MCLILLAWRVHEAFPLVVAANRDEFFSRPSQPAHWWPQAPEMLAGRDLQNGGTWLGVTRGGLFAALTNYRDPLRVISPAPSRGMWVPEYLSGGALPEDYLRPKLFAAASYNGFNLLLMGGGQLCYFSSLTREIKVLSPGLYGVSNHLLDTPWPKVVEGRSQLATTLAWVPDTEPLFHLLRDERIAPDSALPATGVSLEWERLLSSAFVRSPHYGTRCSTVMLRRGDGTGWFEERSFGPDAVETGSVRFDLPAYGA